MFQLRILLLANEAGAMDPHLYCPLLVRAEGLCKASHLLHSNVLSRLTDEDRYGRLRRTYRDMYFMIYKYKYMPG